MTDGIDLPWPLGVPLLSDGEIVLRAHTVADITGIFEMGTDPLMQRFTTVPTPYRSEEAEDFVHHLMPDAWSKGTREWAIEVEGRFAGNVGLRIREGETAEITFALHPWARGRGIMKRACALVIDWGFTEAGIDVIRWRAVVGNEASLRVAHGLGFTLDTTVPHEFIRNGRSQGLWCGHLAFGDAPVPQGPWLDPVLQTAELRLRPLVESDAAALLAMHSDPASQHWLANVARPYGTSEALEQIFDATWRAARGTDIAWAVTDSSERVLGMVNLMDVATDRELSYVTAPEARGRGLMTRAVRAVTEWATSRDGLDAPTLLIRCAAGNTASRKVAKAAGFTEAGLMHNAEPLGDRSRDDLVLYEYVR